MYVITFANPKGGSGKTTSAMLLAEQVRRAGGSVGVLDCDPNQNIVQWADTRQKEERDIPFLIQSAPNENDFLDTVDAFRGKVDYLIIDLEGTASQMVTYAISQSDLVLVPFEPTPMEARQAARAVQLTRNVGRMANRHIPHVLLLTRVNAAFQTSEEKDVRKATETGNIPVLPTAIVRRAPYTRIFRECLLLSELKEVFAAEVAGGSQSQQERVLKPIDSAIQNATAYAQDVMNILKNEGAEA